MLHLTAEPTAEPVSLADVKLHLRVDSTDEDALILALIAAARRQIEAETGRALLTQTWELWLDAWPAGDVLEIPLPPLASVSSIKYYDTADTEATLSAATYYVDAKSEPGRVALADGQAWPTTTLRPINGVCVTFVAGWTAQGSIPTDLLAALKLLTAWLYENRGDGSAQSPERWPRAVEWLCSPHRVRPGFA